MRQWHNLRTCADNEDDHVIIIQRTRRIGSRTLEEESDDDDDDDRVQHPNWILFNKLITGGQRFIDA